MNPDEIPDIEGKFHIAASDLIDAIMTAQAHCSATFLYGFNLLSVTEMPDISIANWPYSGDPEDFDETTPQEELMTFTCTCGTDITIANNGWEFYSCPDCDKIIDRNKVIEDRGKFFFVDMN